MSRSAVSAIMLFMLVISTLTLAFKIQSAKTDDGTIYLNSDGSITPSTTPISTVDHVTYTLTGDINDSIIVQKANIVIDGNGYTIQGPGSGFGDGIFLSSINNVTIKNTNITGFDCGIYLYSSNNTVMDNNVTANNAGIGLCYSYNTLSGNSITRNSVGISSNSSSSNTVSGNNINENNESVILAYCSGNVFYHNNFINNIQQATLYGSSQNFWDDGCEGNYWSDYKAKYPGGVEIDSSGIMNPPYVVDSNNTDNYPLMNVYWSPCDINHDLKVDMKDVGRAARAFNTVPGDALWNPHADITGPQYLVPDGKIDMRDIGLIARHFGDHYVNALNIGIFYSAWYGAPDSPTWSAPQFCDYPVLGNYSSADPTVIKQQLVWMKDLGIDFVVIDWWGFYTPYQEFIDNAAKEVLKVAKDNNISLKFAILVSPYNPDVGYYDYAGIYNHIYDQFVLPYSSVYYNYTTKPMICFFNDEALTDNGTIPLDGRFNTVLVGQTPYVQWVYSDLDYYVLPSRVPYTNEISVTPRFDDSRYRTPSCVVDPNLTQGIYYQEWGNATQLWKEGKIDTIMITSWNEYVERTEIEPHYDKTANNADPYFLFNTTKYYINQIQQLAAAGA